MKFFSIKKRQKRENGVEKDERLPENARKSTLHLDRTQFIQRTTNMPEKLFEFDLSDVRILENQISYVELVQSSLKE